MLKYKPKLDWKPTSSLDLEDMTNYVNLIFELRDKVEEIENGGGELPPPIDLSKYLRADQGYDFHSFTSLPFLYQKFIRNNKYADKSLYATLLSDGRYTTLPSLHPHLATAKFKSFNSALGASKSEKEVELDTLGNPFITSNTENLANSHMDGTPIMSTTHTPTQPPIHKFKTVSNLVLASGAIFKANAEGNYWLFADQSAKKDSPVHQDLIKKGKLPFPLQSATLMGFTTNYIALLSPEGQFALFNPYTDDVLFNRTFPEYIESNASKLLIGKLRSDNHNVTVTELSDTSEYTALKAPFTMLMGAKVIVTDELMVGFFHSIGLTDASNVTHDVYSLSFTDSNNIPFSCLMICEGNQFSSLMILDSENKTTAIQFFNLALDTDSHQSHYITWQKNRTFYYFGEEFTEDIYGYNKELQFLLAPDQICVTNCTSTFNSRLFYMSTNGLEPFPLFTGWQNDLLDFYNAHDRKIMILGYTFPVGVRGTNSSSLWTDDNTASPSVRAPELPVDTYPPSVEVVLQMGTNIILAHAFNHSSKGYGFGTSVVPWSVAGIQSLSISPDNPNKDKAMLALSDGLGSKITTISSVGAYVGLNHYAGDLIVFKH